MNVVESMPTELRPPFVDVLAEHAPDLLAKLRSQEEPSTQERAAVEDIIGNEVIRQLGGDNWEPSDRGQLLERVLDEFLTRWPIESPHQ